MPQLTLYAPNIDCEHCIGTIESTVGSVPGARFLHGDPNEQRFSIEVERGAVLDELAVALAAAGYPLGDVPGIPGAGRSRVTLAGLDAPPPTAYQVTRSEAGARVESSCPCGCRLGFELDRARAEQEPAECCCGRLLLVAPAAGDALRARLERDGWRVEVERITMPWGQPMEAALATPPETSSEEGL